MHIPLRSLKWTDLTSLGILFDGVNIADDSRGMMRQESRRSATREGGSRSTPTIIGNHTRTGFGDFSLLIGWTVNHEETQDLDYVDATLRIGGLFPTSSKQNASGYIMDVANGYNGHYAIPMSFDFAIGWYDWVTVGTHLGAMPFFKRSFEFESTYPAPGTIWEVNAYFKADHMILGVSFLFDYSFVHQGAPAATGISATDPQFNAWTMQTLNFLLSYDFATCQKPYLPEVGFFYNLIVGGARIYNTNMAGGMIGWNVECKF